MTRTSLAVTVAALYYASAAYIIGRHEWRRHRTAGHTHRARDAALAAVAWPWFVWMGARDERGAWCIVARHRPWGTLPAQQRVVARYWTRHGAERHVTDRHGGWLEVTELVVRRCDP